MSVRQDTVLVISFAELRDTIKLIQDNQKPVDNGWLVPKNVSSLDTETDGILSNA
jgi:hypothetical protein